MKQIFTVLTAIILMASVCLPKHTSAQAPQKMSYQAVIRNSANNLVTSQSVGMRVSILQGSATGTEVFKEIFNPNPQTNANGLVTIDIGAGIALTGTFATINWAGGPYFIKTETDPTGGTNYTITGTSQLLSVPYALMAKNIDNNAVTSDKLANNAVTSGKIENNAVTSEKLAGNTITANKLSNMGATAGQVLIYSGSAWAPQTLLATSNPWQSSGSDIYFNTGKVGIGTNSPTAHLNIHGNSSLTMPHLLLSEKDGDFARLMFRRTAIASKYWTIAAKTDVADPNSLFNIYYFNGTTGYNFLNISGSGYVGINHSPDPNRRLYVDGEASGAAYFANNSTGVNTLKAVNMAGSAAGYFENNGTGHTLYAKNMGTGPAVYCDGTLTISGGNSSEVNRDQTGTANMLPICYGNVASSGSKNLGASTSNFTAARVSTGVYEINITSETYSQTTHTCVASLGDPGFINTIAASGKLRIYTYGTNFLSADREFSFVVYKP